MIFFLLISLAFAQLHLDLREDQFFLMGENTDRLQQEVQNLSLMNLSLPRRVTSSRINITNILSPQLKKLLKLGKTHFNGPNCFNATLYERGLLETLRYVGPKELKQILRSRCQRIEAPFPGAIVLLAKIRGQKIIPVHTYTHIGPHLSFTKNGFMKENPYILSDPTILKSEYEKFCENKLQKYYFRCSGPQIPANELEFSLDKAFTGHMNAQELKEKCLLDFFGHENSSLQEQFIQLFMELGEYTKSTNIL